jgi:preprotein translocase subunit SecD
MENPFTSHLLESYVGGVAVENSRVEKVLSLLSTTDAKQVIPSRLEFLWAIETVSLDRGRTGRVLYLVEKQAHITGRMITEVVVRPDPYLPSSRSVVFTLGRGGATLFSKLTAANIGRQLAIVLDGEVRSAPRIETRIPGGEARIDGGFSDEEANDLAIILRSGSLPAGVRITEERLVAPAR